jgi:two-component system sensor histidine kinase QseC
MPRVYSLKARLLAALLAALALVWLGTALYSYFETRHEISRLLDAHLAQSASLIVAQLGHELEEIDLEHAPQLDKHAHRVAFQVWEGGTILRLHSANAPPERLSPRTEGFSDATIDGKRWRVFSAWDARHRLLVQVGERDEARREIAAGVATGLLAPLAFALPALGLLAWLVIARALRPLRALGAQVAAREPDSLGALAAPNAPGEVLPLVASLNALFARVARMIEHERRFTADAAHELRTPLAALKTQAQVALGATGDAERRRALENVLAGCERASRLVEQLLTLARLEPGELRERARRFDLREVARRTLAEVAPATLAKSVDLELAEGAPESVEGYPELVSILIRNLVDNAVRYGPVGGAVRVEIADGALSVTDQGPGIAPEERARVGERFYRVLGNEASGSGLGLSIVRRVAEIHGAAVRLEDGPEGKGLRVTVAFRGVSTARGGTERPGSAT